MGTIRDIAAERRNPHRREIMVIAAILILGAIRVLLFNLAFPAFNNVDEPSHFDMVVRYSRWEWPTKAITTYSQETAQDFLLYGSPEYMYHSNQFDGGRYPEPSYTIPDVQNQDWYQQNLRKVQQKINYEAGGFPFYYLTAGIWSAVGRAIGIEGIQAVFWVRFLNVPLFCLLVWLAYQIACMIFPESVFFRIGVPMMAAFFPQDLFFTINSDCLSAVLFTAALYLLLRSQAKGLTPLAGLLIGFAAAATFLTKISNFSVLLLLSLWGLRAIYVRRHLINLERREMISIFVLLAATATPILMWFYYCKTIFHDWTGNTDKIHYLGWSVKSFSEWFNHPIFTPSGLGDFLADLTRTFWRGELYWHGKRIASPIMDGIYIVSTIIFLISAAVQCFSGTNTSPKSKKSSKAAALSLKASSAAVRWYYFMFFFLIIAVVTFMAWLSIRFDFGRCLYPSQKNPFFTSGRLIFGIFIPFLFLYLSGYRNLFFRFKTTSAPLIVLGVLVAVMAAGELVLNWAVFYSPYNWFHLP